MTLRFWIWLLLLTRRRVASKMRGAWWVDENGTLYRGREAAIHANSLALFLALQEEGR